MATVEVLDQKVIVEKDKANKEFKAYYIVAVLKFEYMALATGNIWI